jgi:hypothetical protein
MFCKDTPFVRRTPHPEVALTSMYRLLLLKGPAILSQPWRVLKFSASLEGVWNIQPALKSFEILSQPRRGLKYSASHSNGTVHFSLDGESLACQLRFRRNLANTSTFSISPSPSHNSSPLEDLLSAFVSCSVQPSYIFRTFSLSWAF